ncbi:MAG: bifunctional phosphoribosylaminoimidazolecarboxamide formyltransferase/IMP cyclohydrolase [Ferruginibacter sp.]
MQKKIGSALISVFYKEGLDELVKLLHKLKMTIYSTGGTRDFIESLNIPCTPVEALTNFPTILGGRVKTLHPGVFGGILGKRDDVTHQAEMQEYSIPEIDLVIVDLYPFAETVAQFSSPAFGGGTMEAENLIIEKIDIGGPSMLRAAAKNHKDVTVLASKTDYALLHDILSSQNGSTTLEQRRMFAIKAFDVCTAYDVAISNYFNHTNVLVPFHNVANTLRYGENPHQQGTYFGDLQKIFTQLNGKELSYNNLVDVDAAIQLIKEFESITVVDNAVFAIIKHTNVCGIAQKDSLQNAWQAALGCDPESAFGGVLVCNQEVDLATAEAVHELFFEVLIAPGFSDTALQKLATKKNRILLALQQQPLPQTQYKSMLNGMLSQQTDTGNYNNWQEAGGRESTSEEKQNLGFANIICKHLKSNAIALIKNMQLVGKGCGQTSRIDALKNAIDKATQFDADLQGAVLASDAFFPFDDCVKIAHAAGITAFIQPGGSIRDDDSFAYCRENNLAMVVTGMRHFKH